MDAKQEKGLLELADFLDVLPDINFHMPNWHGHAHEISTGQAHGESQFETPAQAMECGTACCVAGWAALLNSDEWMERFGTETNFKLDDKPTVLHVNDYCFAKFFGIDSDASETICTSGMHYSATEKADQIRAIVENFGGDIDDDK